MEAFSCPYLWIGASLFSITGLRHMETGMEDLPKVDERMTNGKRKEAQANGIDFSHIHRILEGEELRGYKTLLVL